MMLCSSDLSAGGPRLEARGEQESAANKIAYDCGKAAWAAQVVEAGADQKTTPRDPESLHALCGHEKGRYGHHQSEESQLPLEESRCIVGLVPE